LIYAIPETFFIFWRTKRIFIYNSSIVSPFTSNSQTFEQFVRPIEAFTSRWEHPLADGSIRQPLGASASHWEHPPAVGSIRQPMGASASRWEHPLAVGAIRLTDCRGRVLMLILSVCYVFEGLWI